MKGGGNSGGQRHGVMVVRGRGSRWRRARYQNVTADDDRAFGEMVATNDEERLRHEVLPGDVRRR